MKYRFLYILLSLHALGVHLGAGWCRVLTYTM